ncbi:alpha-2,8-sialyltransferase 8F-like isoform X1 [Anguilla anguilla]|uniref:ST8 alpha-N-acetyl-neuraminide alpha-2,8-sialyltransferase 6 n=1 Tax=Anguilla anguilla TaxID=7936 RepID=A0A9D3MNN2_ANGAN|nr:alpha-2,8-sialyltransferase 8F-like isoform X1 [Anguilla anguilla]KAG5852005.1 hypothetical protein ANANG_G00057850 [Anguilla anguilla]
MAAYLLKWSFLLMMITMMVHTFVVLRGTIWIVRDEMTDFQKLRCTKLREIIFSLTASKINTKSFTEDVRALMSCPHESNITQRERHRVELRSCCNATGSLFLTRQNTREGQRIKYETNRKKNILVDKSIFKMLPKSTPWRNDSRFQRCAVVGNGGILRNSSCGAEIDSADIVFRLNMAPINNSRDVGVKTSLVTINPSQIRVGYPDLQKRPQPLVERVSAYGDAPLLMPAFAYTTCTDISFKVHKVVQKMRPNQKVVFFNPEYLLELFQYWKHRGLEELRLTTGLMLASVAMELCDSVHLYGFWPFELDLFQCPVTHHYYDNVGPSRRMHAMPKEFLQLLKMHCQGSIHLQLTRCH